MEKGEVMKEGRTTPDEEKGIPGCLQQSPHLGHREPGWKNRQSMMSYLSTGKWNYKEKKRWMWAVGTGASIMVIVIIGLLAGLLSRR